MAYRYAFSTACRQDLDELTKRNHRLLLAIVVDHIPAILANPQAAGEKKGGKLKECFGYNLSTTSPAYRLIYAIRGEAVTFIAIGAHDRAYSAAERRI